MSGLARPPVQYARSADVLIAYQVTGGGAIDLVRAPAFVSHLEIDWESPFRTQLFERVSSFCRLIRFDKRGTGMSDRPSGMPTLEERTDDIRAVMDASGSERAVIWGASEGGSMACLYAATYPERTRGLLLWGTSPRWSAGGPWGENDDEGERLTRRILAGEWPPEEIVAKFAGDDPSAADSIRRYFRNGASPTSAAALVRLNRDIDVSGVLGAIRVPTLILHRVDDPVASVTGGRVLAKAIPGARLVEFPGATHNILPGPESDRILAEIELFVTGSRSAVVADRFLATILFVDVVGSTEQVARVGDASWRTLLEQHYAAARRELAIFGGIEVDTAGDGLLATFDGPTRAVRCARAIQQAAMPLGLPLRAGVHTGEVERSDGAIRGIAVHIAARVAALADAGEVLVSSTVRDLVVGSGLAFEDRGKHELKGVPEPRQVLALAA